MTGHRSHDLASQPAAQHDPGQSHVDPEVLLPLVDVMLAVAHGRAALAIATATVGELRASDASRGTLSLALPPRRTAAALWREATADAGWRPSTEALRPEGHGFGELWRDIDDGLPVRERLRLWVLRQQASGQQGANPARGAGPTARIGAFVVAVRQEMARYDAEAARIAAASAPDDGRLSGAHRARRAPTGAGMSAPAGSPSTGLGWLP